MNIFLLPKKSLFSAVLLLLPFAAPAQFFNASMRRNAEEETYKQAQHETRQQNYAKAIELAKKAVDENPRNMDYNLLLGRLYIMTKQYAQARPLVVKVLDRSPKYKDAYLSAIAMEIGAQDLPQALHYANEGIEHFPNDRAFAIKKLSILDADKKFVQGDSVTEQLLNNNPGNADVTKQAIEHYRMAGVHFKNMGYLAESKSYFKKIQKIAPDNKDAMAALTGLGIQTEDYPAAMQQIAAGLSVNPTSYDLLMKKLSLLQEMHRYADALAVLKTLKTEYTNDEKVKDLDVSLRLEASRYYEQTDPYVIYQSVLAASPGNTEALNKLIAISMDRGVYLNALQWINKGLRSSPGDATLLSKKADVLEIMDNHTEAAEIIMTLWKKNPSSRMLSKRATDIKVAAGKYYLNQRMYTKAVHELEEALYIDSTNEDAENYLASVYIEQKDYDNALLVIDKTLRHHKDDEQLLLKKASVLADAGRYNEAFPIIGKLIKQHPDNKKYGSILTEHQLILGRQLMNSDETEQAILLFKDVLVQNPGNRDALTYLINLESGVGRPQMSLVYLAAALTYFPNDKDFLFKRASVLSEIKEYQQAAGIAKTLMTRYPYNKTYMTAYIDYTLASGGVLQKTANFDEALSEYKAVLAVSPTDTQAMFAIININNTNKEYDSALTVIDNGLVYYNTNIHLIKERVYTLEYKEMYAAAADENDRLQLLNPSKQNADYSNYLRSKTFKNQFGLYYQQSIYYGRLDYAYRVGMMEYRRFFKNGSFAARVNYAVKDVETGLQYEGDMYYKHTKTAYSYLYGSFSDAYLVFPTVRLGYSIFKTWGRGFETEIGGRYSSFRATDSTSSISSSLAPGMFTEHANVFSGIIGLSQTAGDFWFNAHVYFIYDQPESTMIITDVAGQTSRIATLDKPRFYQAYQGVVRYYMNTGKESVAITAGTGTSPDDRTRIMLLPQLAGNFLSKYVSVGYQKTFAYRTTLSGNIGMSNYKIATDENVNSLDAYLSLTRKF